jgi:ATP-dependent DNA ligase
MLARSGRLPLSGDNGYEVKWDGFRAIVSTDGPLRVRSRRGSDMAPYVGFLSELPVRAVLDGELVALDADGPQWRTPQAFDDGEALRDAVCEHELEGVVAKPRRSRYLPGERGWVKVKNRGYWRYEMEREGALKHRGAWQFV